jgi:hypothetical protein
VSLARRICPAKIRRRARAAGREAGLGGVAARAAAVEYGGARHPAPRPRRDGFAGAGRRLLDRHGPARVFTWLALANASAYAWLVAASVGGAGLGLLAAGAALVGASWTHVAASMRVVWNDVQPTEELRRAAVALEMAANSAQPRVAVALFGAIAVLGTLTYPFSSLARGVEPRPAVSRAVRLAGLRAVGLRSPPRR